MTTRGQNNDYAFPGWAKNLLWLILTVASCVISVMIYIGDMKTDIAVLKSELGSLKELYQTDVQNIKENVREINDKLKEK